MFWLFVSSRVHDERKQFSTSILCFLITGLIPTGTGVIGPSGVLTGSTSVGKKHVPSDN